MAEVMSRAARRAKAAGRPKIETGIHVVPMDLVEMYYHTQIAREGIWNDNPAVIVTGPQKGLLRADDAWFNQTLAQMRTIRQPGTNRYVFPAEGSRGEIDMDIGLIDVQVFFNAYSGQRSGSPMTEENFRRFHGMCGGDVHTQMVMATAVHHFRPDGSHLLHYHNMIFSIRKQVDPDEHIGVIDLLPLVKSLGTRHKMYFIEDV